MGNAACREGLSVRSYRIPTLIRELAIAQGDGQYFELLKALRKAQLLILDDWGLANLQPAESRDLLEVLEDRAQRSSTLVASQLPVEHWHQCLGTPPSLMPSWTGLSTTPIRLCCEENQCGKQKGISKPKQNLTTIITIECKR